MGHLIESQIGMAAKVFKTITSIASQRREEKILIALEANGISIKEAKLRSSGYLACILRTIEAVERASNTEKIILLRNLFIYSDESGYIEDSPDFYQEILGIVSELSYRELLILKYLQDAGLPYTDERHVKTPEASAEDEMLPNAHEQWADANKYCAEKIGVSEDVLAALTGRLQRSGLVGTAAEWVQSCYFFTPLYRELRQFFAFEFHGV